MNRFWYVNQLNFEEDFVKNYYFLQKTITD